MSTPSPQAAALIIHDIQTTDFLDLFSDVLFEHCHQNGAEQLIVKFEWQYNRAHRTP